MEIISGTALAKEIRASLAEEVAQLKAQGARTPRLVLILVGDDPTSINYVDKKFKAATEIGYDCERRHLPATTTQSELLAMVKQLNVDPNTDGILVQLPLPDSIDGEFIVQSVNPLKDVDGLNIDNVGNIVTGKKAIMACTPRGVISLLRSANVEIAGKHAVVAGRSNLVGMPMVHLLLHADATVTVCHSKTKNIAEHISKADILISAMGKRNVITPEMLKPGVVLIDVAMNRDDNGKLCGDIYCADNLPMLEEKVAKASPVPGGVGPMTIASLMQNTMDAYKQNCTESK